MYQWEKIFLSVILLDFIRTILQKCLIINYTVLNVSNTNTHPIHEYLRSFQTIQSINDTALPEEIKEILSNLQTSKNHLNSYFNELKSNYIEFALSTIKEVESAYQSSYNRNNDILSLLSILIDNYKEDSTLYHNITNHIFMNVLLKWNLKK